METNLFVLSILAAVISSKREAEVEGHAFFSLILSLSEREKVSGERRRSIRGSKKRSAGDLMKGGRWGTRENLWNFKSSK
jgi:hypothetical protein